MTEYMTYNPEPYDTLAIGFITGLNSFKNAPKEVQDLVLAVEALSATKSISMNDPWPDNLKLAARLAATKCTSAGGGGPFAGPFAFLVYVEKVLKL
jgi:hypothetical protein